MIDKVHFWELFSIVYHNSNSEIFVVNTLNLSQTRRPREKRKVSVVQGDRYGEVGCKMTPDFFPGFNIFLKKNMLIVACKYVTIKIYQ